MADLGGYVDSNTLEEIQRCEDQVREAEMLLVVNDNMPLVCCMPLVSVQIRQRIPRGGEGIRVHRSFHPRLVLSSYMCFDRCFAVAASKATCQHLGGGISLFEKCGT
eukprot:SAG31_NODE_8905_length_1365_cov_1.653239_2_plen_107_part_00